MNFELGVDAQRRESPIPGGPATAAPPGLPGLATRLLGRLDRQPDSA